MKIYLALITLIILISSSLCAAQEVNLSWDENEAAAYYTVSYGTASGEYTSHSDPIQEPFYTLSGLPDNVYYIAVKAHNACGNSSEYSEEVIADCPSALAPTNITAHNQSQIIININHTTE